MPAPYSSLAIANEFIRRSKADEKPITQMQVQKLVYLAHGWALAGLGVALLEDQIQAWDFGPVVPRLYFALRRYGRGPINEMLHWGADTPFDSDDDGEAYEELSVEERSVVDLVWTNYGSYPAFKLSALTHQEGTPWTETFEPGRNRPIGNAAIQRHFEELLEAA